MGGRGVASHVSYYGGNSSGDTPTSEEIASYLGLPLQEATAAYDAVRRYTGSEYQEIRESQIEGKPSEDAELVEKFIEHAPQWADGTTYRGVGLSEADIGKMKVGAEVKPSQGALGSWSADIEIAQDFAGTNPNRKPVVFVAKTQKHATSVTKFSKFPHEAEVLVSSRTRYRVTKMENKDGIRYVHVDVL